MPVFDAQGRLVLGPTAIEPGATFDASPGGRVAARRLPAAVQLSRRLGWNPARG